MKFRCVLRSSAFAIGLAGCAQQQAGEPKAEPPAVTVALVLEPAGPAGDPEPKPEPPPPTFDFPNDQAGAAIARVVAPNVARPLPTQRLGAAPRPRAVPARILEPDATTPASYVLPPVFPQKPFPTRPAAPPEKVPHDLGARADAPPAEVVLPVAAVVTERARDVNLPPPAPILGRPLTDRVGLDDPTGELGNAVVVGGAVKVPPAASGFVKVTVPDPFELGEQVKPKVPATAEPSVAPVPVNPQRGK